MKRTLSLLLLAASFTVAQADISLPRQDTFYDKLGRGIANTAFATSEILVSHYQILQVEGPTVAFSKGLLVQGPSRAVMDMGLGIFDIITSPFPIANIPEAPEAPTMVSASTQTRRVYRTRRVYNDSGDNKNMGSYKTVGYWEDVPVSGYAATTTSSSSTSSTMATTRGTAGSYSKTRVTNVNNGNVGYADSAASASTTTTTTTTTTGVEVPFWGTYGSFKCRPYDSMVVNEYPPSDLVDWY